LGLGFTDAASLLGGLAFFLYGLDLSRSGLERASGGRLKAALSLLARRPLVAALLGVAVTLVTQSSSAVAVILVGMVSSGLLAFPPTVGVLLGADVGTTLTVQALAFEIRSASLVVIAVGTIIVLASRRRRMRYAGQALLGFGLLFFGMHLMKTGASPLASDARFGATLAAMAEHPLLGVLAGTVVTGVVQSSAATVGLVLALAQGGALGLDAAIPIVLGANVGTAVTGAIAAVSATRGGKRVALAHVAVKVLAVGIILPFVGPLAVASRWLTGLMHGGDARAVANAHLLFNVGKLVVFLPLAPLVARLIERLLPDRPEVAPPVVRHLTGTGHDSPEVVLAKTGRELANMARRVHDLLARGLGALEETSIDELDDIRAGDGEVNALHAAIVTHLRETAREELSLPQVEQVRRYLYLVKDLELLGDGVAEGLAWAAERKLRADASFSVEGGIEIGGLGAEVSASFEDVACALSEDEGACPAKDVLARVAAREAGLDQLVRKAERAHFERAASGVREAEETDAVFTNVVGELRRMHGILADMASVIADSRQVHRRDA